MWIQPCYTINIDILNKNYFQVYKWKKYTLLVEKTDYNNKRNPFSETLKLTCIIKLIVLAKTIKSSMRQRASPSIIKLIKKEILKQQLNIKKG